MQCGKVSLLVVAVTAAQGCASETESRVTSFQVASWNTFLRPIDLEVGILPPSDPLCRARGAGQLLEELDIDLVGLQEMLDPKLQAELVKHAPSLSWQEGPRPTECERDGLCAIQPGGLTFLGVPELGVGETYAKGYARCQGTDCLANKGLVYAPVFFTDSAKRTGAPDLHVVQTHLQAADGEVPADEIRLSQFAEIRDFLEQTVCADASALRPVILLGDLNTAYVPDGVEGFDNGAYEAALDTLEFSCLGRPTDVFDEIEASPGTINCVGGLLPTPCMRLPVEGARIDHVWYWPTEALTLQNASIVDGETSECETEFLSDHRMVRASFEVALR